MSMRYLFFEGDHCKVCHEVRPQLMARARESGVTLEVFNVGHAPHAVLASRLLVCSLPTLVVLHNERVVDFLVGTGVLEWEPPDKARGSSPA